MENERTQKAVAWQYASFLQSLRLKVAACSLVLSMTLLSQIIRHSNVEGNQQKCENTRGTEAGRWWVTVVKIYIFISSMKKGTTEQEQIAQTRSQLANRKSRSLIIGCVPTLNYSIHFNECVHICCN